ncbi:vegetative cell wall protein gp1-like [Ursus maritimus]|uniref:Vegetative cell wall protein gp1-like n=1 Tax=Ursus maritimus TaxID=29073 RepID=A0A8M1FVP3_URSMA|nr:vegetative cell wall protein gp1-like [Ursus maritimus]
MLLRRPGPAQGEGRPPFPACPGAPPRPSPTAPARRAPRQICPAAPQARLTHVPNPRLLCSQRRRSPSSPAPYPAATPPQRDSSLQPPPRLGFTPLLSSSYSQSQIHFIPVGPSPTPCSISPRPSLTSIPGPSQTRLNPFPSQPPTQLDQPPWPHLQPIPTSERSTSSPSPSLFTAICVSTPHPTHFFPSLLPTPCSVRTSTQSQSAFASSTPVQPTGFPWGSQFPTTPLHPCLPDHAQPQPSSIPQHSQLLHPCPSPLLGTPSLTSCPQGRLRWGQPRKPCLLPQASGLSEESQLQFQKQHLTPDSQVRVPPRTLQDQPSAPLFPKAQSTEISYRGVSTAARASWNISTPC